MADPIPEEWRLTVCRILAAQAPNTIDLCRLAWLDWQSIFPSHFRNDLYRALTGYLNRADATGKKVTTMLEKGETYEFIFENSGKLIYSKLNLLDGKLKVKIYSAHLPRKGNSI